MIWSLRSSLTPSEATSCKILILLFFDNSPAGVYRVKYKRKIFKPERVLVVCSFCKIIGAIRKLGENRKVIGNKGKENFSCVFADPFCFTDTFLLIFFLMQMIKRSEKEHDIEGVILKRDKSIAFPWTRWM